MLRALALGLTSATLALQFASSVSAHSLDGYVEAQARTFFHDPLYPGQSNNSASGAAYLEYFHDFDEDNQRIVAAVFGRWDSADANRSHGDIRELYWWKDFSTVQTFIGVRKVYWGVAESLHLVDIINQDDMVENIDGEDKLGQLMTQFQIEQTWGTLDFFILPGFREKTFPGVDGRLRPALPIAEDARYESGAEENHIDLAVRWSHMIGEWDLGLSHFAGTQRDPYLLPQFTLGIPVALQPYYAQVSHSGLDIQATLDAWLWKLELISVRDSIIGRHTALVSGFEYTFYGLGNSGSDLGALLEYQFDDRSGVYEPVSQNDVALGLRWVLNDLAGTEVLAVLSQDLEYDNRFVSIEASRRLTDDWEFSLEARFFGGAEPNTPDYQLRNDDYIEAVVRFYF